MECILKDIIKIQKAIREKSLVIFVGAGVSANSGVPTWGTLIDKIAKELKIEKDIQQNEYLKIAQYYYNNNPKTFFASIKNFLDGEWQPNSINEYLFQAFKPKYFVTTNYDDILEKTSNKLSMPYSVVAQDKDIPKVANNNAIIKMHGDFRHGNIVLKEDDYLKYSEKYRLMEVFIKSLFATNTILFVGFSADDQNVNQIYSWVNSILQQDQREAYLLQIDDVESDYELKRKYFDKKGIHIINYSELAKPIDDYIKGKNINDGLKRLNNVKGKQLYKLLHFIKNATPNILDQCYQKLLPTRYLNFLSDNDISQIINYYWSYNSGILSTSHDKKMGELITFLKRKTKKAKETKELLSHLGIRRLIEEEWVKDKIITKNELTISSTVKAENEIVNLINEFNYIEAEKFLGNIDDEKFVDEYIDTNIDSVNVFEKVYILLKLHRYELAYNILRKISFKAKENGNNFVFIISEFNRKIVFHKYHLSCYYKSSDVEKEELDRLQKECWAINIPDLITKLLSEEERNIIEDKLNFKFIEKLDKRILKNTVENSHTKFCLKEIYDTFVQNYIFIDNYQEYQKLCFHCISSEFDNMNNQDNSMSLYDDFYLKQNKYDFLDLLLIVKHAKTSDLNNLIFSNKINELHLNNESDKSKLLNAYINLIKSILHFDLCKNCSHGNKYLEYLYNFFIIFMLIPLTKDEATSILKNYLKLIEAYNWYEDFSTTNNLLFYLLNFIIRNFNKTYGNTNLNSQVLADFLVYVVNNSSKIKDVESDKNQVIRFVSEVSDIVNIIAPKLKIESFKINESSSFAIKLYSFIYKFSNKLTKEKIKKLIVDELDNHFNHELYQYACLENIIKPLVKYEKKLIEEIDKRIDKYNELKITKPTTRNGFTNNPVGLDEIHDVLRIVANLLNFEKLKNPKHFEQYKEHKDFKTYNYFLFAIDMEDFDYNKFKLEYLNYLTKNKREQLRQIINTDIRKKEIIKEKFINSISLDKDTNNRLRDRTFNLLYDESLKE